MSTPADIGTPPSQTAGDRSLGDLISEVTGDLSTLMRQELALAQAHLAQALASAPANVEIEARYRAISARIGRAAGITAEARPAPLPPRLDPVSRSPDSGREVRIAILPEPDVVPNEHCGCNQRKQGCDFTPVNFGTGCPLRLTEG